MAVTCIHCNQREAETDRMVCRECRLVYTRHLHDPYGGPVFRSDEGPDDDRDDVDDWAAGRGHY